MLSKTIKSVDLYTLFIIDSSGSMSGEHTVQLNQYMDGMLDLFKQIEENGGNIHIQISALRFSTSCSWIGSGSPVTLEEFKWKSPVPRGLTSVGTALEELKCCLDDPSFIIKRARPAKVAIFFISDGYATDYYQDALEDLKSNQYYNNAFRACIRIGDETDDEMLEDICGNRSNIFSYDECNSCAVKLWKFL